jgi:hypothetical protein
MSIKTQRKVRRVHATMGVRTMGLDAEDEHRICIETRAKPGATVVPHRKWVRGAWHNENGELVLPPNRGRCYIVDCNISPGRNLLFAYPSQDA